MRRAVTMALCLAAVGACSSPTEPPTDFDPGRWPYVVSPMGVRIHGTSRILVIPARFADGPPAPVTASDIEAQMFGGANGGLIAEALHASSGGSFTLHGEVTPWVTTSITREATSRPGTITESGGGDYVWLALQAVDTMVDFGRFDNDGPDGRPNSGDDDGVVDGGVVVMHSGLNLYCDPSSQGTHPHAILQWRPKGARYQTQDSSGNGGVIEVGAYTALGVTGCTTSTVQSHVVLHELGHLLFRLPDLYRFAGGNGPVWTQRRWTVGCWDLMAAGTWGCGSGTPTFERRSAGLGAWSRVEVGWVTPMVAALDRDSTYELRPFSSGGSVLRIPVSATEYFLLEYRERGVGDDLLPANGVLVYHVDDSQPTVPTSQATPPRVFLVEADDDSALGRTELLGGNRGVPGDAFGITRRTFRSGEHTGARTRAGLPLPFEIPDITIDASARRARVRVTPPAETG